MIDVSKKINTDTPKIRIESMREINKKIADRREQGYVFQNQNQLNRQKVKNQEIDKKFLTRSVNENIKKLTVGECCWVTMLDQFKGARIVYETWWYNNVV